MFVLLWVEQEGSRKPSSSTQSYSIFILSISGNRQSQNCLLCGKFKELVCILKTPFVGLVLVAKFDVHRGVEGELCKATNENGAISSFLNTACRLI